MKLKKLLGLMMILAMAVLTFTACSSSDDDDKDQTGTFQYEVTYSMFNGGYTGMTTVSNAFMQAFGVSSLPISLTGTRSECDRKAKEYAIKAQAALANEGSFGATVEFTNLTTGDVIHSFTIVKDDNGKPVQGNGYWWFTSETSITFKNLAGKRLKIASYRTGKLVFDGTIESDSQTINFNRETDGISFHVTVENGDMFKFRLDKKKD